MLKAHKYTIADTSSRIQQGLRRTTTATMGRRWSGSIRSGSRAGRPGSRRGSGRWLWHGENAIFLAEKGYRVVAFDAAPVAVEKARIKARQRGFQVAFEVADARELMAWDGRFETIMTPACSRNERERRPSAVCKCAPTCVSARCSAPFTCVQRPGSSLATAPRHLAPPLYQRLWHAWVAEEEIRAAFSDGWTIESLEERLYGWERSVLPASAGLSSDERARSIAHNQKCDLLPCPGIGFHSRVGSSVQYVCLRGKQDGGVRPERPCGSTLNL